MPPFRAVTAPPLSTWAEFWSVFHRRWGSDRDALEYEKQDWHAMMAFLEGRERVERRATR